MRLILSRRPSADLATPLLALPLFSDRLPTRGHTAWCDWRLDGAISDLVLEGRLTGQLGQKTLMGGAARVGADRLLLFGCGPAQGLDPDRLQEVVAGLAADAAKLRLEGWSLGVVGRELEALAYREAAAATVRGLLQDARGQEAVRLVEEDLEDFGLLVREVRTGLRAMAASGQACELILEDDG